MPKEKQADMTNLQRNRQINMAKLMGTFHKYANMHHNNEFLLIACRGVKQFHRLTVF
jgi:hypothetical protein